MGLKVGLIYDVIGLFELFPVHLGDGLTGHECPDMLD